jgi:hypothetical protein
MKLRKYNFEISEVINFVYENFKGHEELFKYLRSIGDIVVFGGVPRDLIFFNIKNIRDIDLVVTQINNSMIDNIIRRIKNRRTRFGGFKCTMNKMPVDIWALNETWAFKQKEFKYPIKVENLPKTVFLSIDAIILNISTKQLYDYNFKKNFEKKTIDIIFKPNPFPSLCVLRAFKYSAKYNFKFSEQLNEYVYQYLNNTYNVFEELRRMYISHYGGLKKPIDEMFPEIKRYLK